MAPKGRPTGRPAARKTATQDCACTSWDFREHCSADANPRLVYDKLRPYFSKFVWQQERGAETGRLHWQGRGRLIKKLRAGPAAGELQELLGLHYFKPTVTENHISGAFSYMMKEDTRVAGPWSDKTPPPLKTSDVSFIEAAGLPPWAIDMTAILKGPVDPRKIYWISHTKGNGKKSAIAQYWQYHGLAEMLPYVNSYKDFLQFSHGYAHRSAYCINLARAIGFANDREKHEFGQFLGALESLKDGFVYDCRNSPKKEMMDRPHAGQSLHGPLDYQRNRR
jgi:hypothetical protein